MRGGDIHQETLFSTVVPEQRVPKDHPLRLIQVMVNDALAKLDEDFNALHAESGKPPIPVRTLVMHDDRATRRGLCARLCSLSRRGYSCE